MITIASFLLGSITYAQDSEDLKIEIMPPIVGDSKEALEQTLESLDDEYGAIVEISDPAEPLNRKLFLFNAGLLKLIAPVGKAYTKHVPHAVRNGIENFADNLNTPSEFVSNIFALEPKGVGKSAARFVVNTTVGLAGIFDVATMTKWRWLAEPKIQNFNDVFAKFGAGCGPHIVVPFAGSFYAREALAKILETPTKASFWVPVTSPIQIAFFVTASNGKLQQAAMAGEAMDSFLDAYAAARSAIYQMGACKEAMPPDIFGE